MLGGYNFLDKGILSADDSASREDASLQLTCRTASLTES